MGARVLLVDGDEEFASAVRRGLQRLACRVDVVPDASAAVAAAEKDPPNLLLAATRLPGVDGFALCDRLRGEAKLSTLPVVLLWEEGAEARVDTHRKSPSRADDYLRKPITLTALMQRIGHFLLPDKPKAVVEEPAEEVIELSKVDEVAEPGAESSGERAVPPPSSTPLPKPPRLPSMTPAASGRLSTGALPTVSSTSMRPPGMSSREYLDIREQLTARDRRILELKDELRAAENKLEELKSRSDGLQRANHDLLTKLAERDAQLADVGASSTQLDALRRDKELANKRTEDNLRRAERAKQAAEATRIELVAEKERRAADATAHRAEIDELTRLHEEKLEGALETQRTSMEEARERALEEHTAKMEAEIARIRQESEEELARLRTAYDEERVRLRKEQDAARAAEEARFRAEVARADQKVGDARLAAIGETEKDIREELEPQIAKLKGKLQAAAVAAEERLRKELSEAAERAQKAQEQAVSSRERVVRAELELELATLRKNREEMLAELSRKHETALAERTREHEKALAELRARHDEELSSTRQRSATEATAETERSVRAELEAKLEKLSEEHTRALTEARLQAEQKAKESSDAILTEAKQRLQTEQEWAIAEARAKAAGEIADIERAADDRVAEALAERNRARTEAESAWSPRVQELEERLVQEQRSAQRGMDDALAELSQNRDKAEAAALEARDRAQARAMSEQQQRHEARRSAMEATHATAIADLEAKLHDRERALTATSAELEKTRGELEARARAHAERIGRLEADLAHQLERAQLPPGDEGVAEVDAGSRVAALEAELSSKRSEIEALETRAIRAEERVVRDKRALQRAREALALATATVDEARTSVPPPPPPPPSPEAPGASSEVAPAPPEENPPKRRTRKSGSSGRSRKKTTS